MSENVKNNISSKICSTCGGEADGWKCSKCGFIKSSYDPLHWRNCPREGKLVTRCKKCGESENNCKY